MKKYFVFGLMFFSHLALGLTVDFPNSRMFFTDLKCFQNESSTLQVEGKIKNNNNEEELSRVLSIPTQLCAEILARVAGKNCGDTPTKFYGTFNIRKTVSSKYGFTTNFYEVVDIDLKALEGPRGRCLMF